MDATVSRRRVMMAPLAVAGLAVVTPEGEAVAQEAPAADPERPAIVVQGNGEAGAPATGAILQIIARPSGGFPGKEASPEAMGQMPVVTEEQLAAVLQALVAGGIAEERIEGEILPAGPFSGPFGPGVAVIVAAVEPDLFAALGDVVSSAIEAGTGAGLMFDTVNLGYMADGCADIERAALADAAADGAAQAVQLAQVLGVELGDLIQAVKQPPYSAYGYAAGPGAVPGACTEDLTLEAARRTYLPTYDQGAEPEVEIYVTLQLTYAIG